MSQTDVTPLSGANYNERATCTDYVNFITGMTISQEDGKNAHRTCKSDHWGAKERIGEREWVEKRTNAVDRKPLLGAEIGRVQGAKCEVGFVIGKVLALEPL